MAIATQAYKENVFSYLDDGLTIRQIQQIVPVSTATITAFRKEWKQRPSPGKQSKLAKQLRGPRPAATRLRAERLVAAGLVAVQQTDYRFNSLLLLR